MRITRRELLGGSILYGATLAAMQRANVMLADGDAWARRGRAEEPAGGPDPLTVPFSSDWSTMEFPGGHGALGQKLMWEHTDLADPKLQAEAREACRRHRAAGRFPMWEMAWDDPKATGPGLSEWTAWKQSHRQYWMQDREGQHPTDPYYVDAISAAMPYDPADLPPGLAHGTRNDWDRMKLTGFARATGAVGYFAADKYDLGWAWHMTSDRWDFNPRVVEAFAARHHLVIPGTTAAERAAWILAHLFSEWTDFLCEAIAIRHTQLQPVLKKMGIPRPIVAFQVDFNVTASRIKGLDMRMMARRSRFGEVLKRVEMQADPGRPPQDRSLSPSFFGLFACRAPGVMHGGQMASLHPDFYASLARVGFPSTPVIARQPCPAPEVEEYARKYVKQHWLGVGWWHIAGSDGHVRRGVCEWTRTYWDSGRIPEDMVRLAREIRPVRPFGLALYYSVPVERAYENEYPATRKLYPLTGGYSANTGGGKAHEVQHAGVPVGYSVSDEVVGRLRPDSYPTGWLTCGADRMPSQERRMLERIAPAYNLEQIVDLRAIPSPIRFSPGACGYAFEDQRGRSIFLIWRQGRGPAGQNEREAGNTRIDCTVSFEGVRDGRYTVQDLFDLTVRLQVRIAGGRGEFTLPLDRWDCRAFWSDMPSPNR